ncbi:NAD-dependent epimerase/dehydratase family protein [Kribbella sp. CA-293567]|uniref:NAD-dependent epimerase/dehydratase family protein n=1 Tax=Kribbella sp. CA-293567 TaxID=3002436 RepID=UPI0022DDADBF|nr:NAD-dependent epimerase/dehydratase family protein [Kribbella sp. CA-293567]WBQ03443.1 NAD-dependent epimerase/dehydratase family protein [Kribbella sp. CA-293567]
MRIVVTGASGNVGSGLLRALARDSTDHEVIGVCRRPPPAEAPFDLASWYPLDVSAPDAESQLTALCSGADAVVHLAWAFGPVPDWSTMRRVNVEGTAAVLAAAAANRVPHVVHTSSIAAYGARQSDAEPVSEAAATPGIPGSAYGRDKSDVEELIRRFAEEHTDTAVTVVRPTLVAQRAASSSFRALFFDPLIPTALIRLAVAQRLPVLPLPDGLAVQFVHADDLGDALVRILQTRATGAFNLAAEVLDAQALAGLVGARQLDVPPGLMRSVVSALWRLRLLRMSPGWFDVATRSPVVDTARAREQLSWSPAFSSLDAAAEQLRGLADEADGPSPVLRRDRLTTEPSTSGRTMGGCT